MFSFWNETHYQKRNWMLCDQIYDSVVFIDDCGENDKDAWNNTSGKEGFSFLSAVFDQGLPIIRLFI